jgi:hypothetical protein
MFEAKEESKKAGKKEKNKALPAKRRAFYSKTSGIGQLKREHSFKFMDTERHRNRPTTQGETENTKCSRIEIIGIFSTPYYQPRSATICPRRIGAAGLQFSRPGHPDGETKGTNIPLKKARK